MKKIIGMVLFLFVFQATGFSTVVDGEYQILKGEILEIKVAGLKRLLMYEQGIVDVISTKTSKLELMGAQAGETIVEVGTKTGKRLYRVSVIEKDMDEVMEKISRLLHDEMRMKNVEISKNELTNRILLSGDISEKNLEKIDTLLGDYAQYVDNFLEKHESEDIVEVDVEIVEVNKTRAKSLGIRGFATSGQIGVHKSDIFTFRPFFDALDPGSYAAATLLSSSGDTQGNTTGDSTEGLWLDFLVDNDVINVLSRPRVACISGKEASLNIGGSVPVLTTGSEGQTSVEFQSYGIDLSIAPVVRDDGYVELNLNVSVSEPTSTVTIGETTTAGEPTNTTATATGTETRSTSTVVLVKSDDTLSISGLMKTKDDVNMTKFPWLADVPVLGMFFRHKAVAGNDLDLMIMVTPKVKKLEKSRKDEKFEEQLSATKVLSYNPVPFSQKEQITSYTSLVRERILSSLIYPQEALHAGWEAEVMVSVHLAEDGYLLGAKIMDKSGHSLFDDSLIRTIKDIRFFPKFPPSIKSKELWLEIPFVFELN